MRKKIPLDIFNALLYYCTNTTDNGEITAMKARMFVTLCLGAMLAAPALAAPSPTVVVQDYLTDRNSHNLTAAYALLSPATKRNIPLKEFAAMRELPADPTMTPALRALFALILDIGVRPTYEYRVIGADPADAGVVLVNATPHDGGQEALTLKLVTVTDPQADGAPRLDLVQSLDRTDPEAFRKAREAARAASSMSNLKQLALSLIAYAQTHNNRLPDADHWADEILPDFLVPQAGPNQASPADLEHFGATLFRDPSAPEGKNWTYAFNRNLSRVPLSSIKDPANTVLVFESTTGIKNAADAGQSLPRPGWHNGGSHVAFADGHVKLIPDKPTAATPAPKFAP